MNLLRQSPTFAFQQTDDGGLAVITPDAIPNDDSIYWVHGTTKIESGTEIPSVFVLEHGGGTILAVYWYVNDTWHEIGNPATPDSIGLPDSEVFPYDWCYTIPVQNDIFH